MCKFTVSLMILLLWCSMVSSAQARYEAGFLPNINLIKKIDDSWKLNFRIESRQQVAEGLDDEIYNAQYDYILTDYSGTVSKKVGYDNAIAAGYLIRSREGAFIHRLTQQFTIANSMNFMRLGHRFRTDQSWSQNVKPTFRFRYRITSELPLNGQSIDVKEWYFKINNEYLNSWQGTSYDFEIRLVPLLGYEFSKRNRIEGGLDYRISDFVGKTGSANSFWLTINWYVRI